MQGSAGQAGVAHDSAPKGEDQGEAQEEAQVAARFELAENARGVDSAPVARAQTKYQVRFDWGMAGSAAITDGADVLVLADAMGAADVIPAGFPGPVLAATGGNREATARWVLAQQHGKGDRFAVAVVAAGDSEAGGLRFCVEDLLLAGGVIDALADVGIDYASPEAAAAAASYQGLHRAVAHILSASVTGQSLLGGDDAAEVDKARQRMDVTHVVRVR